ncbi:MAG: hypothetical protein ACLQBD_29390 [Syntrophobacteraceae bacterium]
MSVLYFASVVDGIGERLQAAIEASVPVQERIEVYRKVDNLTYRLRQLRSNLTVAVILAANQDELTNLLSIKELIRDLPVIMVLPDREQVTIRKGFALRPRYFAVVDSDFSDVTAVLNKMLGCRQENKLNKRDG